MNILITGSSRGIGAAAYALLKSKGHNVAGHSTRGSEELLAGDLEDPAAPRLIWDGAVERLGGRIDVLVNNAGDLVARRLLADIDDALFDQVMNLNARSVITACRAAVAHMRRQGSGSVSDLSCHQLRRASRVGRAQPRRAYEALARSLRT